MAVRVLDALTRDYSDDEERDAHGSWTKTCREMGISYKLYKMKSFGIASRRGIDV
jgi:hypothetical protein